MYAVPSTWLISLQEYRQHAYCLTSDDWSSCVEFKAASDSRQMKQPYSISYEPAESRYSLFGGNSNWRGPIWLPGKYLST